MIKITRYIILAILIYSPFPSIAASCQQSDDNEKFACENYASIKKNVDKSRTEANKIMVGNSSLKSLNTLYDLQLENCNNYKCLSDVSSKYFMVVNNAINLPSSPAGEKLTLEQACEATTYMRYYSALAAFSPPYEASGAEVNARRFGAEIMVTDINPFVESYLSPSSARFRQGYLQGEAVFSSMFTAMIANCQSSPTSFIPTLPRLVRSDVISFDSLIKIYKK